ncbi:hypothetical protein ACHQM5_001275 [Ranunculus cassubicifolius]
MKVIFLSDIFFFILSFIISTILQVDCTEYTVGDEERWSSGISYVTWSESYNFTVGDILDFNYVSRQHNVFEVTRATYRSCNTSTGVLKRYKSGMDKIKLKTARNYWFICAVIDHCRGGMKVGVHVQQQSFGSPPIPVVPAVMPPSVGNSGSKFTQGVRIIWALLLLVLGI